MPLVSALLPPLLAVLLLGSRRVTDSTGPMVVNLGGDALEHSAVHELDNTKRLGSTSSAEACLMAIFQKKCVRSVICYVRGQKMSIISEI